MKSARIELPTIQNWSCQGCTECCRGKFVVTITTAEKQRIEQQAWTPKDGVDPARMIVPMGNRFRLEHQNDGACVFLDASGRCRIHAKFGEAAKPLTCQMYPWVIHPGGDRLKVGLRFSCPSAALNHGRPVTEHLAAVQQLARLAGANELATIPPPPVASAESEGWPDLLRFVKWIDASLADKNTPVALKLVRTLHWLAAVERGKLDQITGSGAEEILEALTSSTVKKVPEIPENDSKPSVVGRLFLRLMVLEHAREITVKEMAAPGQYRSKMFGAIARFIFASGHTPPLREGLGRVRFADMETGYGPLSLEIEAMLTRYFRVKVQSLHFCGHAFHGRPLIEGFRNLTLLFPMIVWLSRWLARSDDRPAPIETDVARAIAMVDDHFHYSAYSSWRVKLLQQRNDVTRLCSWYGRTQAR